MDQRRENWGWLLGVGEEQRVGGWGGEQRRQKKKAVSLPGTGLFPLCPSPNPHNPFYMQTKSMPARTYTHTRTHNPPPPCQWGTIKLTRKTLACKYTKCKCVLLFKVRKNARYVWNWACCAWMVLFHTWKNIIKMSKIKATSKWNNCRCTKGHCNIHIKTNTDP